MKKYYEVGEVFLNNGDVIRVVEHSAYGACKGCQFYDGGFHDGDYCNTSLVCSRGDRYDGKYVIYAKIDQLEEGEEFKEEDYAK